MPKYYDSRGDEVAPRYDISSGKELEPEDVWLTYWTPLLGKTVRYDEAIKLFEKSIELKAYNKTKEITPYKLKEGYKRKTSTDGKRITIFHEVTGKPAISRVLSDEEYEDLVHARKIRKRKAFIDKALANAWTHWATLTFSPEVAPTAAYTYQEAKEAFMQWRKSVKRSQGDFKYMAIAEYGSKQGRIHWHALLYFPPSTVFKQVYTPKGKALFLTNSNHKNVLDEQGKSVPKLLLPRWRYGFTDFYPVYNGPQRAVSYMAKYMTKDDEAAPYEQQGTNAKAYLSSKGLKNPKKEYLLKGKRSKLLDEKKQDQLEKARPTFRLLQNGAEIMHKSEAFIDDQGESHILHRQVGIIDVAKKEHRSTTNHPDAPQ
ncbi:rolling circle replication-associated protein [Levilactobacillus spicheri]|uniref:Replication-associated protein ORF2/G2P domain-containing protein n=1 Tax=Levilactobacillus spicheri TaxID=216463 RepID=A0ABQ0WM95_9LACO|nr:hypothetical protein [Levilactobacillus spicheri]GEO65750.1 hypothetical protein LSP04_01690 [Levilactobacillus spicheri]